MHITFVCTGNTCRSPMAEGIARKLIEEKYPDSGITVSSAGLMFSCGCPASQYSIDVCHEIGIDLNHHRSQSVNPEIIEKTDLFAVMTESHREILLSCHIPEEKIRILGEGIPDPIGGDEKDYRECRDLIREGVETLLDSLNAEAAENSQEMQE